MAKSSKNEPSVQLYTDAYFESGHWLLKLWQTFVAVLAWICVFVPIVITVVSFYGVMTGKLRPFWHYAEGVFEIRFIGVILLFLAAVALIFSVTMTIIQVRKRDRLVEQWPTFDPIEQRVRETELEVFMDERFGPASFREDVRNYRVSADKNLDTDEFQKLFEAQQEKEAQKK